MAQFSEAPLEGVELPCAPTRANYGSAKEAALAAEAAKCCVIPATGLGTKKDPKAPLGVWKKFQTERPSRDQILEWYAKGRTTVGIVTGGISDDLECLDFDNREVYQEFVRVAELCGMGRLVELIEEGYCEDSPHGVHWLYRCRNGVSNSNKLAKRPTGHGKEKTLIETKGEGGYIVVAPTTGVHENDQKYVLRRGGFDSIVFLSTQERDDIFNLAKSFDEVELEASDHPDHDRTVETVDPFVITASASEGSWKVRPGDDFDVRGCWDDILVPAGWKASHRDQTKTYWTRPGKEYGTSATTSAPPGGGPEKFRVFSSSTDFKTDWNHSKFQAYVHLHHQGDFRAAARALVDQGYGVPDENQPESRAATKPLAIARQTHELDDSTLLPEKLWPAPPSDAAFDNLAGELVRTVEPYTEADPIAILAQTLILFGNCIGRTAYAQVEATRHYTNTFMVLVGESARARKGTSADRALDLLRAIDSDWRTRRVKSGMSSGEGLIGAVRDPLYASEAVRENGKPTGESILVLKDPGEDDKRLMVVESEFGSVLRALEREGNRLSAILRNAFDSGNLNNLTKSPMTATDAHISIIGHIVAEELLSLLNRTDTVNGLANRFLWICAKRSKQLPFGGEGFDHRGFLDRYVPILRKRVEHARSLGHMPWSTEAKKIWPAEYARLTATRPGVIGSVISRAEAHTLRLSLILSVLEGERHISARALRSAIALVEYSERCARYIFGESLGNPHAETIFAGLKAAGPEGLTKTAISKDLFKGNIDAKRIESALGDLIRNRLVFQTRKKTTGRPSVVFSLYEFNELDEITTPRQVSEALSSFNSSNSYPIETENPPRGTRRL
jgi:hypothetical protein